MKVSVDVLSLPVLMENALKLLKYPAVPRPAIVDSKFGDERNPAVWNSY